MRKVLIFAALLMASSGTSHAGHCQDSTDWAGFTVPCHPVNKGVITGGFFPSVPTGPFVEEAIESGCGALALSDWAKFDDCIREYKKRRAEFDFVRLKAELAQAIKDMEEKRNAEWLPQP